MKRWKQHITRGIFLPFLLLYLSTASGIEPQLTGYKVQSTQFSDRVEALGTLRATESAELASPVTEVVSKVLFTDGQRVQANDILLEMTRAEESAQLEEARSRVREATLQYQRVKELVKERAASKSLIDQRKRDVETSQAQLNAVQARLADRMVIAPFSGVVGLRNISKGALLKQGDIVTTLDDDSTMKLDFQVPTTLLRHLSRGSQIKARTPAFPKRVFSGKIVSVDSRVNPLSRAVTARAVLPNPDAALKAGMLMTVSFQSEIRSALAVPEEAVLHQGAATYVASLEPTSQETSYKVSLKEIEIGLRQSALVEVLSGLSEGDLIVRRGLQHARPGSTVQLAKIENHPTQ
jgi:membrane fusion protein (multidrug efflux system)